MGSARDVLDDAERVGLADGGHAVGEEDDHAREVTARGARVERFGERRVDRRAARRDEVSREVSRAAHVVGRGLHRAAAIEEHLDVGREPHHLEVIGRVEAREHVVERGLGAIDLLTGHRARRVEHEEHLLGGDLALGDLRARRDHREEVAVLALAAVGEEREPDVRVLNRVVEVEVLVERDAVRLEAHLRVVIVGARHADGVRGRVDGADGGARDDVRRHRHVFEGARRRAARLERVAVVHDARLVRQRLREADLDALLGAGLNGKDARAEEVPTHVLDEPGVLHARDDLFIDGARPRRVEELALLTAPVHPHREAAHRGALGHREHVRRLEHAVGVVLEALLDAGLGHALAHGGLDAVVADGERVEVRIVREEEADRVGLGGRQGGGDGERRAERGEEELISSDREHLVSPLFPRSGSDEPPRDSISAS